MATGIIPDDTTRLMYSGHVMRLLLTVRRQAARVLTFEGGGIPHEDFARAQDDAYLLTYALRDLRLLCIASTPWAADRMTAAVETFDRLAPGIKDVRDIYSHIDEYEKGEGRLQRDGVPREKAVAQPVPILEREKGRAVIRVPPFSIELPGALNAAEVLAGEALDVLNP